MARGLSYPRANARTKAIRHAMVDAEIGQNALARRLKVDAGFMSKVVTSKAACAVWLAEDIAKLLNKPVGELFDIVERPPVAEAA